MPRDRANQPGHLQTRTAPGPRTGTSATPPHGLGRFQPTDARGCLYQTAAFLGEDILRALSPAKMAQLPNGETKTFLWNCCSSCPGRPTKLARSACSLGTVFTQLLFCELWVPHAATKVGGRDSASWLLLCPPPARLLLLQMDSSPPQRWPPPIHSDCN